MTNKEKYISSFSGVEPSDKIKERILDMTSTKKRYSFKVLAAVFAVIIMATAMLTANAATDGAIGEKIGEVSKEITKKISVMFNGEEIEVTVKQTVENDEHGNTNTFEIILPDNLPENEQNNDKFVFALDEVMEEYAKVVIEKSKESSADFELDWEKESENYKVVVESN